MATILIIVEVIFQAKNAPKLHGSGSTNVRICSIPLDFILLITIPKLLVDKRRDVKAFLWTLGKKMNITICCNLI